MIVLFGFVNNINSKVENLGLTNVVITGNNDVSGLAGRFSDGTMSYCYVTGAVVGNESVGLLFGLSDGNATINRSYTSGSVTGLSYTGGLFGGNASLIYNCYSRASVTRLSGTNTTFCSFGGSSNNWVEKCYSTGSVTYSGGTNPTDKGFLGSNSGTATSNFFDATTSGQTTGIGASAKTTTEMQTQSTFTNAGWSSAIWNIGDGINDGYPYLDWQNTSGTPLPVEIDFFNVKCIMQNVELNWQTATEVKNYGFEVERSIVGTKLALSEKEWQKIGFIAGHGNSNSPKDYSFVDANVHSGSVSYRLKQIDLDGSYKYSEIVSVEIDSPKEFVLEQNYPNPFNPETTIRYVIPSAAKESKEIASSQQNGTRNDAANVTLKVYDILGKEVETLVNERQPAGNYEVKFDGSKLSSGVYLYKLQSGGFVQTRKLILMK